MWGWGQVWFSRNRFISDVFKEIKKHLLILLYSLRCSVNAIKTISSFIVGLLEGNMMSVCSEGLFCLQQSSSILVSLHDLMAWCDQPSASITTVYVPCSERAAPNCSVLFSFFVMELKMMMAFYSYTTCMQCFVETILPTICPMKAVLKINYCIHH